MAGKGRAPKDPSHRINRHAPSRGEWTDLADPAPDPDQLPDYRQWTERTRMAWQAWWADPVSSQWSVGDRDLVLHLAEVHERWMDRESAQIVQEIRQLREHLGLTPKGRQDRRWRYQQDAEVVDLPTPQQRERSVRAVEA